MFLCVLFKFEMHRSNELSLWSPVKSYKRWYSRFDFVKVCGLCAVRCDARGCVFIQAKCTLQLYSLYAHVITKLFYQIVNRNKIERWVCARMMTTTTTMAVATTAVSGTATTTTTMMMWFRSHIVVHNNMSTTASPIIIKCLNVIYTFVSLGSDCVVSALDSVWVSERVWECESESLCTCVWFSLFIFLNWNATSTKCQIALFFSMIYTSFGSFIEVRLSSCSNVTLH